MIRFLIAIAPRTIFRMPLPCAPVALNRQQHRRRQAFHDRGRRHAEGGEDTRVRRDEDAGNAERCGEVAGVQGAGAAEGDEREAVRVVAAFDGDLAEGALHVRVGDAEDSCGGAIGITSEGGRDSLHGLDGELVGLAGVAYFEERLDGQVFEREALVLQLFASARFEAVS